MGKLQLDMTLAALCDRLTSDGVTLSPIVATHALCVETLPFHHRDPFDRILAAHALVERMPIVSADARFDEYGVRRVW